MPVSVSNTAYGIISDAMHDAGFLQEGDEPNSEQLATNLRRLCDIINLLQTEGIKLFLLQEISITLVEDQESYTVDPTGATPTKHMRVEQGRIEDSSGNLVRPIRDISWQEWNTLSRANSGNVLGYLQNRQATSLTIKLWNKPDASEAANSLILLVRTQATNPFNLENDVAFPQEWRIALRWLLADDICTGQPQAIMDRCQQRANIYKEQLADWDVESAEVTFTLSNGYEARSFR